MAFLAQRVVSLPRLSNSDSLQRLALEAITSTKGILQVCVSELMPWGGRGLQRVAVINDLVGGGLFDLRLDRHHMGVGYVLRHSNGVCLPPFSQLSSPLPNP